MNEVVLQKLNDEVVRELDYAHGISVESDAYGDVMKSIRENCEILNEEYRINTEEYKAVEEVKFRERAKALDVSEHRKDRWTEFGKTVGMGIFTAGCTWGMFKLALKFEEHGCFSSSVTQKVLNWIIKPK